MKIFELVRHAGSIQTDTWETKPEHAKRTLADLVESDADKTFRQLDPYKVVVGAFWAAIVRGDDCTVFYDFDKFEQTRQAIESISRSLPAMSLEAQAYKLERDRLAKTLIVGVCEDRETYLPLNPVSY